MLRGHKHVLCQSIGAILKVRLHVLELELNWPKDVSIVELREWLLAQLKDHGDPLRWSITGVKPRINQKSQGVSRVEAVVTIA